MTIPLQLPQIHPDLAPRAPSVIEQIAPVLEAINQRKLVNAQVQNYQSLAEQRKMEAAAKAQDLQDQADAAQAFYGHVSGITTHLRPEQPSKEGVPSHQGVDAGNGTLIPLSSVLKKLTPGALVYYQQHIKDYNSDVMQQQQVTTQQAQDEHTRQLTDLTRIQAQNAANEIADNKRTQDILQSSDLTTDRGQLRAVRRVLQEVGPKAAGPIAQTLNTGTGFDKYVSPDGTFYVGHNGAWHKDFSVAVKPVQAIVDAQKRNAGQVVDLLDEQSKLIQDLGIGSSKNPTLAALADGSRILGVSTEGLSNWLRNDPEQLTKMLRTRFSHLYVGLLPHSRSAGQLLDNLTQSYWAPAGSGKPLLARAENDRQKLRRVLVDLRDGKTTDWSRLPGWAAAASAAVSEGAQTPGQPGTTVTPNPDDWVNGVPPQ